MPSEFFLSWISKMLMAVLVPVTKGLLMEITDKPTNDKNKLGVLFEPNWRQ